MKRSLLRSLVIDTKHLCERLSFDPIAGSATPACEGQHVAFRDPLQPQKIDAPRLRTTCDHPTRRPLSIHASEAVERSKTIKSTFPAICAASTPPGACVCRVLTFFDFSRKVIKFHPAASLPPDLEYSHSPALPHSTLDRCASRSLRTRVTLTIFFFLTSTTFFDLTPKVKKFVLAPLTPESVYFALPRPLAIFCLTFTHPDFPP